MSLDIHYTNPKLAALYDLDSGWSIEREFYLNLAGEHPKSVLDLGCGTGLLCRAYASKGHRATGVDPSPVMLEVGRRKEYGDRVHWVSSRAQEYKSEESFDLIIMTGNAFQVLLSEADLISTLKVMKGHLHPEGVIVFESRNPNLDWPSQWDYEISLQTRDGPVKERRVFKSFNGPNMSFDLYYEFKDETLVSKSQIRFWSCEEIRSHLLACDLQVQRLLGDWDGRAFDSTRSKEMVFFAGHK